MLGERGKGLLELDASGVVRVAVRDPFGPRTAIPVIMPVPTPAARNPASRRYAVLVFPFVPVTP